MWDLKLNFQVFRQRLAIFKHFKKKLKNSILFKSFILTQIISLQLRLQQKSVSSKSGFA